MKKLTSLTSITGREFKVSSNKRTRIFTIKSEGTKYKTIPFDKEEFNSMLSNTGNDWAHFMKTMDYYVVK